MNYILSEDRIFIFYVVASFPHVVLDPLSSIIYEFSGLEHFIGMMFLLISSEGSLFFFAAEYIFMSLYMWLFTNLKSVDHDITRLRLVSWWRLSVLTESYFLIRHNS